MKRPNTPKGSANLPAKRPQPQSQKSVPASRAETKKPKLVAYRKENQRLKQLHKTEKLQRSQLTKQLRSEASRFNVKARNRSYIFVALISSAMLLLLLLLATWFTPLLAIEKIEISGLSRLKEKSIMNAVVNLKGTPLTLIDEGKISQRLKAFPLIESFSTISDPPHTLRLIIVERQPIAIVSRGGTKYLYDPAGVQIGVAGSDDKFPLVRINDDPAKSENFRAAVEVMLALPVELTNQIKSVEATSRDDVSLLLAGSISRTVIWGDSSESVLKSKVLAALIKSTKVEAPVVFDVSSPNAPTVRFF